MKTFLFLLALFITVTLYSCANASSKTVSIPEPEPVLETTIELMIDLSNDTVEVWEIKVIDKKCYFSDEKIHDAMKLSAAKKSNSEGMYCFGIIDKDNQILSGTYEYNSTETMHGSNINLSSYYTSNFRNSLHGSSFGSYSYEVPVTKTGTYCSEVKSWHVLFHNKDTCDELKTTKYRERVFFNEGILNSEMQKIKQQEKILEMKRKAENGTIQEYYEYLNYIKSKQ